MSTQPAELAEHQADDVVDAPRPPAQTWGPLEGWPERVPWSRLGPEFAAIWGRADPADPQPEHLEVLGPSGSGKTHLMATLLRDRQQVRNTAAVLVATKKADTTLLKLGWPITDSWADVRKHRQVIFWPRTDLLGTARDAYQERKIRDLLDRLWVEDSNTIVAFDEVARAEELSAELKTRIRMWWREARSQGLTMLAMKQRPQGADRHMSSETYWTAAFVPNDRADLERFAEHFGAKRDWMPVFDAMNIDKREFLLRHSRTRQAYISWVDVPLVPAPRQDQRPTAREYLFGYNNEEQP